MALLPVLFMFHYPIIQGSLVKRYKTQLLGPCSGLCLLGPGLDHQVISAAEAMAMYL